MALLELYRRHAGSGRVAPRWVVEHLDAAEDIRPCVLPRVVDAALDPFTLEQLEGTRGHGVVVAVAVPAHAAVQVAVAQEGLPLMPGKLTALIAVAQHRLLRLAPPQRPRIQRQARVDVLGLLPVPLTPT